MESYKDPNCHSLSDSFSLYERYLRSFNVVNNFVEENCDAGPTANREYDSSCEGNIDLSVNKHYEITENVCNPINATAENIDKVPACFQSDLCPRIEDTNLTSPASLLENSNATGTAADYSHLTEKSDHTDVPVSSEDSKSNGFKQPVFITSTMENSNNAVDSVPLFRDTTPSQSVFKLPISELSFNGTIKHVQKLKPIVDPITAMTSSARLVLEDKPSVHFLSGKYEAHCGDSNSNNMTDSEQRHSSDKHTDTSNASSDTNRLDKGNESTGDSQYEELNYKNLQSLANEEGSVKWNSEQSYSSLEASFDSGVRSPDMFSDEDAEPVPVQEPFWSFLKDFETYDKRRVRKLEETLQGVLPPPSVTTVKTDVTEMLKKYYYHLPAFTGNVKDSAVVNSSTPTKRVSFIEISTESVTGDACLKTANIDKPRDSLSNINNSELNMSSDKSIELKLCTETEVRETTWPDLLKCRYYDVYYNLTQYMEKLELLSLRYGERFVGAETDTSVNIYSGGLQSPSSASKRKAMRLKMAQAKSPGRRLSHLARRRQAFCSAATIGEKAHASTAKMVLIDKNFFPHRKLINSAERKSPRTRRTPGKKTPTRKTPGKKTPAKTPKSGGSTKKKAMRRLLMDSDSMTRSQPRESMIKRALFISPENRKPVPAVPSSSVPLQAMKSKRALFGSPTTAETKSLDGTQSDQFLKRKRDRFDDVDNGRSKIAKSLSFGGDSIGTSSQPSHSFTRRASEVFASKNSVELNETHKKKLLWAVSEALRVHGWRMSSPGFREKASALARLTRRLLSLPPHAARLAAPKVSTSETMLKLARQYVFAIIQGRTVEDCFEEEQVKIANESTKITGYISATAYQQLKTKQATSTLTLTSQVKENFDKPVKQEQSRSASKNILQDKLVNIDTNSNSSSGLSMIDKVPLFKSNSMPSFEEAAKMRARRQISFDNVEFPKR
ncbi:uncharacterized protein LOC126374545 [Pectinophora gossypiella]|uniref:uncharacterized protein LOC126374545 n=1 Tax=Pectinophora gossypiella TaxID=13191 RepID=UPI00214EF752|nr:uncharacterized protein LOC126374545 [Pectinophora gossypiella]